MCNQKEYYNNKYRKSNYIFLRIHYAIRYQLVKFFIKRTLKQKNFKNAPIRVLDFGSGVGDFGIFFTNELRCTYLGLEISEEGASYSRNQLGLNTIHCDFLKEKGKKDLKHYDVIFLHEVFEHLSSLTEIFRGLLELLDKRGIIIFITPNVSFKSFIPKSVVHCKEYSKRELFGFAKNLGAKIKIRYIGGYITSLLDLLQRKMFPVGAQGKEIYLRKLGLKEALWILLLGPLTFICIVESYLTNVINPGYHFFCVLEFKPRKNVLILS